MRYLLVLLLALFLPVDALAVPTLEILDGFVTVRSPSGPFPEIGLTVYDFSGDGFRFDSTAGSYRYASFDPTFGSGFAPRLDINTGFYPLTGTLAMAGELDPGSAISFLPSQDPSGLPPRLAVSAVVPIPEGGTGQSTGLFTASGTLFQGAPDPADRPFNLIGGGTIEATFVHPALGPPVVGQPGQIDTSRVMASEVRFDFTPIPEPGTLLLVGTGAVAMGGAWLRRRRGP
jgi:hypothetical protein